MARNANTKQITLHFCGDYTKILDLFKDHAKKNFRSTEQEILFELNGIYEGLIIESAKPVTDEELAEFEKEVKATDNLNFTEVM